MRTLITSLLLITFSVVASASTEVRSKQISITDGLANNSVRHMIQDSKGFIWLGTLNGLNRYDGNSFISYFPSLENKLSLVDRKVYHMAEDKYGFLWIYFSSEQFSCYDLRSAKFIDYTGNGEFDQNYSNHIFASNGNVWLWSGSNGARQIIYKDGKFSSIVYKGENGKLPTNAVYFINESQDSTVWIGTAKGLVQATSQGSKIVENSMSYHQMVSYKGEDYFLTNDKKIYRYNKQSSSLVELASLPYPNTIISGRFLLGNRWFILTADGVFCYNFTSKELQPDSNFFGSNLRNAQILIDNKQNYWIFNHSGQVWYVDSRTEKVKVFRLFPSDKMGHIDLERYRIVHDSRDIIWISTYGNGLFAYDIAKDDLTHFTAGMRGFNHIGSDYLLHVMEDRSGEIWVSSEFSGVSRITVINEGSQRYFPEDPSLLDRSNTIRLASRMNDEIWIGTRRGGLYIYDSQFKLKSAKREYHTNIYAVAKDKEGQIWLGSRGDGLSINNKWYKNNPADRQSISNNNIFCIHKDTKDRMWIGTFGGGLALAEKNGDSYRFRHFLTKTSGQRLIRSINEDRNNMIWVGTSEGLFIFNPDSLMADPDKYYHYNYKNGGLNNNEVKYLFPDSEGNMWIAEAGSGCSVCKPNEDYNSLTFKHYSTKDGLCNDMVQSISEDNQGNIWIATEYGISKYIRPDDIFENYFFSAYTQGNVYTEGAVCQTEDGNFLFGTNYGFIVFNPESVKKNVLTFPVSFTNLNVNGINMLPDDPDSPLKQSIAYSDEIRLKYNQNSIVIDFSSFNFAEAGQIKYSYKLEDFDKTWSSPSTLNFATYKMLPPGKYELLVKSSNSSGIWSEEISSLKIIITPPFYLTVWAFLLYAIIILSVLYFTLRITRNFNRLNNKISVEKQLTEYKLVFFTNISHEFRTPLTLIQGALERIKRMNISSQELSYPLQTMEKSTRRMLRLIDQLLEFRKMQNNKLALSLEKTDVIAMLYEIFLSFEDLAESKNMDFQFMPSETAYKMFIDKGKLDKITYNLLSNAFKYTPQGGKIRLIVNINPDNDTLEIKVTDTGVGIPQEKQNELFNRFMQSSFSGESVGVGLHLTHELVQVHKGQISYKENEGSGCIFTVTLPLSNQQYEEKDFLIQNNALLKEQQEVIVDRNEDYTTEIIKPNPLNKQKLLVIEDDNDVRQYLKEELSVYFEVVIADNGISGFEMAQSESPDLIVCDVLMPGMTGFEVTRKLKADFQTSHIPVILLTALGLPENHLEGIESGADAYISKPFSFRLLLTRIIKLLEQREKLKEKFSEEPGTVRTAVYASERDKEFVEKFNRVLEENLGNASFTVDEFASQMNLGRTVFYKKVKGITGYSPNEYLRVMRMKKAAELLLSTDLIVSEVSYKVGIEDPFYFSKCFKAQFGMAPSLYQKGQGKEGKESQITEA